MVQTGNVLTCLVFLDLLLSFGHLLIEAAGSSVVDPAEALHVLRVDGVHHYLVILASLRPTSVLVHTQERVFLGHLVYSVALAWHDVESVLGVVS